MVVEGHKVTIKQIGLGLSKPVRVYVDGNRWEFFPGPDAAMRAVKPYINSLNQQNNESFEIKETMSMPSMSLTMSNKKMLDAINMKNGKFVMGEEDLDENQEAYRKFFVSSLKKFGASSPSELSGDKRKEFFNYIKKNWKG
jgi:hypothetical protein